MFCYAFVRRRQRLCTSSELNIIFDRKNYRLTSNDTKSNKSSNEQISGKPHHSLILI